MAIEATGSETDTEVEVTQARATTTNLGDIHVIEVEGEAEVRTQMDPGKINRGPCYKQAKHSNTLIMARPRIKQPNRKPR